MPAFGTFGNSGRNTLEGPGYQNVNLAVIKPIPLGATRASSCASRRSTCSTRANFDLPDAFLGSPTFGQILSAGSPRRMQFGVKALF